MRALERTIGDAGGAESGAEIQGSGNHTACVVIYGLPILLAAKPQ